MSINKSYFLSAVVALLMFLATYLGSSQLSYATTIKYDVSLVSGNTWEYTYTVGNDTLGVDIEEFTVFFDVDLYENLVATTTPANWDPIAIQPDPSLPVPDDGFYDALALVVGIVPGASLGGFGVQFDYLGVGTPGNQLFEVIDPDTFATLDSGSTQLIPLPASIWLFGSGMLGLFYQLRRHSEAQK